MKTQNKLDLNIDLASQITDKEFLLIRNLIYTNFGINLVEQKRSMVTGRLFGMIKKMGLSTFQQYYDHVLADPSGQALTELVNHISTNYTFFYREKEHFDHFQKDVFPVLIESLKNQNSRDIRIWSAGCSSGEEPYMLIMLMMESLGNEYNLWDAGILATDISDKVLKIAKSGIYPEDRLSLLPAFYKKKYFDQLPSSQYQVIEKIKSQIVFRRFNLMNKEFPFKKQFHTIFCRNVMIYFDQVTRDNLVNRFAENLVSGGYLFIGHSETLGRENTLFKYVMPAVYRKI
jgi:chemotaxis protein methyltransferase CheR